MSGHADVRESGGTDEPGHSSPMGPPHIQCPRPIRSWKTAPGSGASVARTAISPAFCDWSTYLLLHVAGLERLCHCLALHTCSRSACRQACPLGVGPGGISDICAEAALRRRRPVLRSVTPLTSRECLIKVVGSLAFCVERIQIASPRSLQPKHSPRHIDV